jgi:hypothetical protein
MTVSTKPSEIRVTNDKTTIQNKQLANAWRTENAEALEFLSKIAPIKPTSVSIDASRDVVIDDKSFADAITKLKVNAVHEDGSNTVCGLKC